MRLVRILSLVLCFVLYISNSKCARILAVFPMPTKSHFLLGSKFLKELAHRGHEITMVSAFHLDAPVENYTNIVLDGVMEKIKGKFLTNHLLFKAVNAYTYWKFVYVANLGIANSIEIMEHPKFRKLLKSNQKFDLLIIDAMQADAIMALGPYYKCPIIGIDTIGIPHFTNYLVGNPAPFAYSPQTYSYFSTHLSFYERFANTVTGLFIEAYRQYIYLPKNEAIIQKYFKGSPTLEEIIYNHMSMILVNSHSSISGAVPHVPSMVEIGGFHIPKTKPLPKELKNFMDNALDGVIVFSLGSVISCAGLPRQRKNAILKTFEKFKQKILWKSDETNFTMYPDNIKLVKWLPQNDILAHPNVKAFITHGGLLGITEAVHHGVPIIGIPIFADQQMNVAVAKDSGYGLKLMLDDLTEETFTATLSAILNNPEYLENARERSSIHRDQPMKPMETAIFWTEYVIRHGGAKYLRSPAMDLHWTQVYLLDVLAVIGFSCILLLATIRLLFKLLFLCKKDVLKKVKQN